MLAAGIITLANAGAALGLVGLLAAAYAVLRSAQVKTTTDLYKQQSEALAVRLSTVEQAEVECRRRMAEVEAANKVLADQVTGTTAVVALGKIMEGHHRQVMTQLRRISGPEGPERRRKASA